MKSTLFRNNMKRRVPKAQRKFAQGAILPPVQPTRTEPQVVPPTEESRNIIHSNMSATNLLDMVSFHGMHMHLPVVLVERLAPEVNRKEVQSKKIIKKKKRRVSGSASEDETPLKFLKNKIVKGSSQAATRPQGKQNRVTRSSAGHEKDNNNEVGVKGRVTRSTANTEQCNGAAKSSNTPEPAASNKSDPFKEPAVPSRFMTSTPYPEPKQTPKVAEAVPGQGLRSPLPSDGNSQSQFYGSQGIVRWMDGSRGAEAAACPAAALGTVRAVLSAPRDVLAARCRSCPACRRIDTVQQTPTLARRHPRFDVYEFNSESDSSPPPGTGYGRRKRRRTTSVDESHLYLDVLEESPHVVQMTSVEIPNSDKRMMRARLVPRDEAQSPQDFSDLSMRELDDQFLDQLLEKLKSQPTLDQPSRPEASQISSTKITQPNTKCTQCPSTSSNSKRPSTSKITQCPSTCGDAAQSPAAASKINLVEAPVLNRSEAESNQPTTTKKAHCPSASGDTTRPSTSRDTEQLAAATSKTNSVEAPVFHSTEAESKHASINKITQCPSTSGDTPRPSTSRDAEQTPAAASKTNLVEAPVFYPTEAEFNDPIAFYEKIAPIASQYGICKVVAPPSFQPPCHINDDIKFNVINHYVPRMYNRWGPAAREICSIRAYLATQNVHFGRVPLLEGLEVNLAKLHMVVQRYGGLEQVIENQRWGRVSDEMHLTRGPNTERLLDSYYVKHLLPYESATAQERQQITCAVEKNWHKRHNRLVESALNPLHHQKKLLGESDSSDEEPEDNPVVANALHEAEDCIVPGRAMNHSGFKKVARHAQHTYLPDGASDPERVESAYWRLVLYGTDHVCVNAASIDTGASRYGFPSDKSAPFGTHPWNLKMLSENNGNVLRGLGPVLGVTVPTLHLGMVFSTSCWHRDPHGLPWIEYQHEGPSKIWYAVPHEQCGKLRKAVETLSPTAYQNKPIWLPSEVTAIPPELLREHDVVLTRLEQKPAEYVIVFPKAYSCAISTGHTISESVYFATESWIETVPEVFSELRESCEPTMFSLEQLLLGLGRCARTSPAALRHVHRALKHVLDAEFLMRRKLQHLETRIQQQPLKKRGAGAWNVREQDECCVCRSTLYLSKVSGVSGRRSSACLPHAEQMLRARKGRAVDVDALELVIFYTERQLKDMFAAVERRLQKHDHGKSKRLARN